jgi:hypothetical protein
MRVTPLPSAPSSDLEQTTGHAGREEVHRDAATHRAGADDRDALIVATGVVSGRRDPCRRALGEERVAQRTRLRRLQELAEELRS